MAYATVAELEAWLGQTPPADAERLLDRASGLVDRATVAAVYKVDDQGAPTNPDMAATLRDATCAQVEYWIETGDEMAAMSTLSSVAIGSVRLGTGQQGGGASPRLAPRAADLLIVGGLNPRPGVGA